MENFKVKENQFCLEIDNIEVGYISFEQEKEKLLVLETYIYPGYRENGYAQKLISYFDKQFTNLKIASTCPYFATFSQLDVKVYKAFS